MTNFLRLHKNLLTEVTLLIAAAFSVIHGGINIFILIFSVLIHELGHITAALYLGVRTENIVIHGFGVELIFPGKVLTPSKLLLLSAAGPIASLLVAFCALIINQPILFITNLSIALINLLPVTPLDGGSIFSCIMSSLVNRSTLRKTLKLIGRIIGSLITGCGILILFVSEFNISLIYLGLFIFFSSDRLQNPVTEITSADYSKIEKSTLFLLDNSTPLLQAANHLPVNSLGAIKDSNGNITDFVTPLQLYTLVTSHNLPTDIPLANIPKGAVTKCTDYTKHKKEDNESITQI